MPFIGRDWRADGEQWTKTEIGSWERARRLSLSSSSMSNNSSLSDVFNALDITNSVNNIRRYHYISKVGRSTPFHTHTHVDLASSGKVVQILFKEKLGELSGNAQRSLFQVIERMIDMVLQTGDNIALMQRLVSQFHASIHSAYPFYYYIGSAALWQRHIDLLARLEATIRQARSGAPRTNDEPSKSTFDRLPVEMQYEILRRLDNGTDIVNMGMSNTNTYRVTQELLIWRQLCLYHFDDDAKTAHQTKLGGKILGLLKQQQKDADMDKIDWKKAYFRLKRQHGLREVYAEMIYQCQWCKCLLWQTSDHSCAYTTLPPSSKPVTPRKLVGMLL